MESCRADWRAANGEVGTYDVLAKVEAPFVGVFDMDGLALLLEKGDAWTQDVGAVDPGFVKVWAQYQGEFIDIEMFVPCTSLEAVKIGCDLLSANIALGARLGEAESCVVEAQSAREAAGAQLAESSSAANELAAFRRRKVVYDVFVQELTAELK